MGRGGSGEAMYASALPRRAQPNSSVASTVRQLILDYPGVHQSRSDVLHSLLCGIGTGFEWRNGALECPFYEQETAEYRRHKPLLEDPDEQYRLLTEQERQTFGDAEVEAPPDATDEDRKWIELQAERRRKRAAEDVKLVADTKRDIDLLCSRREPIEYLSAVSELSPLANIPDDCRVDWLDAAEEVARLVLDSQEKLRHPYDAYGAEALARIRSQNRTIAEAALARIAHLRLAA